jgi:hypothetical protein
MKKLLFLILLSAICCRAQQFPTLSYETVVFNQVTGPSISPIPTNAAPANVCNTANSICAIQNTGMGSHNVQFCIISGSVTAIDIWLEGSNDTTVTAGVPTPGNWSQISNEATVPIGAAGCGTLNAAGYFQWLRLHLATLSGTSPVLTAYYSGIGTALPPGGLFIANAISQPITFVPSTYTTLTGVKSTPVALSSGSIAIYAAHLTNPNAAAVFIQLNCCQGPEVCVPTQGNPVWEVPANDSRNFDFGTPGQQCLGHSTVSCSTTAPPTATDPASGCFVNFVNKAFALVRTQINAAGSTLSQQSQAPN